MIRFPKQEIFDIKKGDLLISEPLLPDENFSRAVILICDDTADAHLGFVINKVFEEQNLGELISDFEKFETPVFIGGPVQQEIIQVLHKHPTIEEAIPVSDGIYWGGDFEQIREGLNTGIYTMEDFWFFLGYSGWYKGQLEKELKENSWLVLRHDIQEVLETDTKDVWKKCMQLLGKEFDFMTKFPIDPRLN